MVGRCLSVQNEFGKQGQQFDNTYRLEPRQHERFYPSRIKKCIEQVVVQELKDKEYNPVHANDDVVHICNRIKGAVKGQNIPNYKIMVQAVIGELGGQGVRVTSKCLWDSDNDNFASFTYVNNGMFCTAMVFGIYFE